MVFEVPKSQAKLPANRFEFKVPGSPKKYSMPLLKYIPPTVAEQVEDLNWWGAVKLIFKTEYPELELLELFDEGEQFDAWLDAYKKESGISLGESGASSGS